MTTHRNPSDDSPLTAAFAAWETHAVPALPANFADGVMAEVETTRATMAWVEAGVPPLPHGFAERVMMEVEGAAAAKAWAEVAVPSLPDNFTDQLMARVEAETPKASASQSAKVVPFRPKPSVVRRVLWPALAAAAALVFALSPRDTTPVEHPHAQEVATHVPAADVVAGGGSDVPAEDPPILVAEATGVGAEVTRMEILGARSYEVMTLTAAESGSTTTVVWIHDKPESDGLETRVQ